MKKNQEIHAKISKIGISKPSKKKKHVEPPATGYRQDTQRDANHYNNLANWGGESGSGRFSKLVKNWPTKTSDGFTACRSIQMDSYGRFRK